VNLHTVPRRGAAREAAGELPSWRSAASHRVAGLEAIPDGVRLSVETPDGGYSIEADYVVAADGVRSAVRRLMGSRLRGQVFNDRFLIADVRMKAEFPTERWFWFDPPFHPGRSALLHRQADDVWRIDLQLGAEADPEEERKPERGAAADPRAMLRPEGRLRSGVGERLHVPVPPARALRSWPRDLRRRRRATTVSRRSRPRRQRRHFFQDADNPRMEARAGPRRQGARSVARQLRRGAHLGRR